MHQRVDTCPYLSGSACDVVQWPNTAFHNDIWKLPVAPPWYGGACIQRVSGLTSIIFPPFFSLASSILMPTLQNFRQPFNCFHLQIWSLFFITICFIWNNLSNWNLFLISSSFSFFIYQIWSLLFWLLFVLFEIIFKIDFIFLQLHPLLFSF